MSAKENSDKTTDFRTVKNCLLLGNGINLLTSNEFTTEKIIERIVKLLPFAMTLLGYQNNLFMLNDLEKKARLDTFNGSVEDLLYLLLKTIIDENKNGYFNKLTETRFLEVVTLLKIVVINAIFTDWGNLIDIHVPDNIRAKILSFSEIFSLNYFEFWDNNNITNYLHGQMDYQVFDENSLGYDKEQYENNINYFDAIDTLMGELNFFPIRNTNSLIMLPSKYNLNKQKMSELNDKYNQFGFMITPSIQNTMVSKHIYEDLKDVSSLTIFGISPFGDDLLINTISDIPNITIYIYHMSTNVVELNEWKKIIPHANFIDSSHFY